MKTNTINATVKAVDGEDPNGEFEVILSAPTLDRDGEIVDAKAFEPLPEHITFDIDHGLSTATTVGSGKPFYDGDLLKVRGTFSSIPRAQEVRTLVQERHIRTTSVAYHRPKTETKDGIPHITKAELLNGAFVPVPANREALVVSSKAHKAGARNSTKDLEYIQGAHDSLVAAGATCDGGKAVRLVRTKTMVGSFEERQEEMSEALRAAYPDSWWIEIIATFDDRVVYEVHGGAQDDTQFQTPYSWDGDEVTFGTATAVDVNEVATPVPAGDEKSASLPDTEGAGGTKSTREDVGDAGGDDEQQQLELRAHALALQAVT
jgi:hypothetical protein